LLASLQPDFTALLNSHDNINGVLVTAPFNDKEYDYHYRYFWPWAGTNEDPVTGEYKLSWQSIGPKDLARKL
jgi:predicted PhzF superfamily epimerase YddE/YHI9